MLFRSQAADAAEEAAAQAAVAGVIGRTSRSQLEDADPVLRAVRLVGDALGVPIRPARGVRGLHPVRAIARASRCRCREVGLVGAWWSDGGPPLVAFEAGHPVALLPARRGGYAVVDPATDRRAPVTASRAAGFEAVAFQLVRPLPASAVELWDFGRFALGGIGSELARASAWGLLLTAALLAAPVATGLIVDHAIPEADLPALWMLGGGLVAVTFAGVPARAARRALAPRRARGHVRPDGALGPSAQAPP